MTTAHRPVTVEQEESREFSGNYQRALAAIMGMVELYARTAPNDDGMVSRKSIGRIGQMHKAMVLLAETHDSFQARLKRTNVAGAKKPPEDPP